MTKFRGASGREWDIHLTLGKIKEIKSKHGIDLLAPWDGQVINEITDNILVFAEIMSVSVALSSVAEAELLADDLRGEALEAAVTAFVEELSDFFLAGKRELLLLMYRKGMEGLQKSLPEIAKRLDSVISETLEILPRVKKK